MGMTPKYKTTHEMQTKIDEYFKRCEGEIAKDADGNIIFNKYGEAVVINSKPLTVTGLALALGFTSRQALLNYQAKDAFIDTVTRAKTRIEEYAETRLFDRDGVQGAKFSLCNNFNGWANNPVDETDNETLNKAKELLGAIKSVIE